MKKLGGIPSLTRLSSKGQLVVPKDIRDKLDIKEGSILAITSPKKDMLVIKKIKSPILKEDLDMLKSVERAWADIEHGNYKESTKEEFLKELEKW